MKTAKKYLLHKLRCLSIIILCVMGFSSQVFAAIIYTDDSRRVENAGGDGEGGSYSDTILPNAPYADMNVSGQTSALGGNGFSASGSGWAYSDFGWGSSWSYFDVSFTLTTESEFTLTGLLTGEDYNYGSGDASIELFDISGDNLLYSNSVSAYGFGYEEAVLNFDSILSAGDYRILVSAEPYFQDAASSYRINATVVSAVPVPAAVWLFGSGLIGLIAMARRRA